MRYQSTPQYVVYRYCVAPTPFGPGATVGDEFEHYDPATVKPGDKTGVGFAVTVPAP